MIPLLFAPGLNNGGIGITAVKGVIHITYQEKHIREFKIRSCFGGGEEAVNRRIEGGGAEDKKANEIDNVYFSQNHWFLHPILFLLGLLLWYLPPCCPHDHP